MKSDDIIDYYMYSAALEKEKKMNEDQMEQVWRSKDGAVTGSKEEVEAYLKSKNPLVKMRFPYFESGPSTFALGAIYACHGTELKAIIAFANLAPLIQPVLDNLSSDWRKDYYTGDLQTALQNLGLAYEEALNQVPQ